MPTPERNVSLYIPQHNDAPRSDIETAERLPGYGRITAWLILAGALAALSYSVTFSVDEPEPSDLLFRYSTAVFSILSYAVLLVPLLLIARGIDTRNLFGLQPPKSWRTALWLGAAILVADFVVAFLYDWTLGPFDEGAVPEFWDASRVPQFVVNFVVVAGLAPIFEEFMYRGVGYGLLERFGTATAIVVTGVLFGLAHGYVYVLPLFISYGLMLGWLRSRTGSIYPGMLVHGATNAAAMTLTVVLA
jgi:membrane protease YdiL (CAAX protease family)